MKWRDVLNVRHGKSKRLGLGVGLGLQGETSGRLGLWQEKKGMVRVRVMRWNGGTS